jgi:type-F conjugative transfer system pilin assembly protein TrbC
MKHLILLFFLSFSPAICQANSSLKSCAFHEPTNEDLKEAQSFIEDVKTQISQIDLENFMKDIPHTPSQKNLKDVQNFLQKGLDCNSCAPQKEWNFDHQESQAKFHVFVSLSLGEEVLKKLYGQVSQVRGRLILRGLVEDSWTKTQEALGKLKIGLDIDPPAFEELRVTQVPTFILGEGERLDRISGVQSVHAVLEQFADQGDTQETAQLLLQRLQQGDVQ